MRVLDIGTGSGAIAVALAWTWPDIRAIATDVSPEALAVARINVNRLGLGGRVKLIESHLFQRLDGSGPFDLVIANPPYVPSATIARLDRSVRNHEPRVALDGGEDGMAVVGPIISQSPGFMTSGGLLALEIDPAIGEQVRTLLPDAQIEQDWQGLDRYCFWQCNRS
jgi:release factor glutamine methyltransferase